MPKCLFCECSKYRNTPYEDTVFNEKTFKYIECTACGLVYVNPLPDVDDLVKMYPLEYQGDLMIVPSGTYDELFEKIKKIGRFVNVLDYGCGGGRFVIEAINKGYDVTGTEYNPELVIKLQESFPQAKFNTVDEFFNGEGLFDIIFLSNVVEHLTNPIEIVNLLKERLIPNGIFVIEGPIENNFNLTKYAMKSVFFVRKKLFKRKVYHAPCHVLYSNKKNQENFFKSLGLETVYYQINESSWPFPSNYNDCDTILKKMMYFVARVSIKLGAYFSFWGNNFVYIGQKKDDN